MLERRAFVFSSVLCTVLMLGSGCLGTGPFEPSDGPGTWQVEERPSGLGGGFGGWMQGKAWRYAVSGDWVDEPGFVTVGVVAEDDQGYLLGSDSPKESARALTGSGGILLGEVERGTLRFQVDDRTVDLLGLQREAGDSWQVSLWGSTFTLVKGQKTEIGGGSGHKVAGVAAHGSSLHIEYSEAAGWFVSFRLEDGDGRLLLGYRLVEQVAAFEGTLESWRALDEKRVRATSERIGRLEWVSPGDADRVLVHVQVSPGAAIQRSEPRSSPVGGLLDQAKDLLDGLSAFTVQTAGAGTASLTLLAPHGGRVVELRGLAPGVYLSSTMDTSGTWQAVASSGGPSVELVVMSVQIERHVL